MSNTNYETNEAILDITKDFKHDIESNDTQQSSKHVKLFSSSCFSRSDLKFRIKSQKRNQRRKFKETMRTLAIQNYMEPCSQTMGSDYQEDQLSFAKLKSTQKDSRQPSLDSTENNIRMVGPPLFKPIFKN